MVRRVATILILASLLLALTAVSSLARKSPEKARIAHEAISRVVEYSMPNEHDHLWGDPSAETSVGAPLYNDRSAGFGEEMGVSFYEYQHNSSMHRQIVRGSDGSGGANDHTIHFEWMYLASEVQEHRSPNYAYYDAVGGKKSAVVDPTPPGEYGGYVSMDVTDGNKAVISCHNDQGAGYEVQVWWQLSPNFPFFTATTRVPRVVTDVGNTHPGTDGEVVWPAMAFQEPPAGDPVTHVIGSAFGGGGDGGSSFHYLRAENAEVDGMSANWVQGWMDPTGWRDITDTIHNGEGWDLCASKENGKVCIVWVNNPPDGSTPGDTCSGNESIGAARNRWDNDLYLQTSDDYGISWNRRQNITKKVTGTDGFRPYADLASMITSDGVFHVAYIAMKWVEADIGLWASRVHHWSEDLGYPDDGGVDQGPYTSWPGNIRTAGLADTWEPGVAGQPLCSPTSFNENASKLSIAECDGKLYIMWTEANSPKTSGNEAQDDCAARTWSNQGGGAANGDLMLAVSGDLLGLVWDNSRSITDSYGGAGGVPGPAAACDGDVIGGGTACPSEHWPSMTAFGSDKVINNAEIVIGDPTLNNLDPGWGGTNYLDISYMDDPDPGGAIMGQGTWQEAKVRWIRIPCVEPVPAAGFAMNPNDFKYPQWAKNCVQKDVDVLIENTGNVTLTYTNTLIEDPSPVSNWLAISNFSGSVASGIDNKETGQVHLNLGGAICNVGSETALKGRVEFNHNADRAISYFEIATVVADTVIPVEWDTITTTCFALTVGNNGGTGNQGMGGVNLDFEADDWRTGQDQYLYDGGTVVAELVGGTQKVVNWGLFQVKISDSVSLNPQGGQSKSNVGWAEMFHTGVYVTNDSSIAAESEFYAPTHADSCNIIIKRTMVYSNDGASHVVTVGEAADWDVPNDSNNSYNTSGDGNDAVFAETGAQLIFLQGIDFLGDPYDTAQSNNGGWDAAERYGVLQYLGGQLITGGVEITEAFPAAHGMYSASNPRFIYPYPLGFDGDSLYNNMSFTGSNLSDSTGDLHSVASYVFEYDLAATDTLVFSLAYISNLNAIYPYASKASSGIAGSVNKATQLYADHFEIIKVGCCDMPGDFNHSGGVDIADLSGPTSMVAFFFQDGPPPPCVAEGDFNGSGGTDIADLSGPTSMVAFFFQDGPPPVCGPE